MKLKLTLLLLALVCVGCGRAEEKPDIVYQCEHWIGGIPYPVEVERKVLAVMPVSMPIICDLENPTNQ